MRVAIIGSTSLKGRMAKYIAENVAKGKKHHFKFAVFDGDTNTELQLCSNNRSLIEWCDEVHLFWDGRSTGTLVDFGMVFALRKPLKIIYLEKKTIVGLMKQYEKKLDK